MNENFIDYTVVKWENQLAELIENNKTFFLILKIEEYDKELVKSFINLTINSMLNKQKEKLLMISAKKEALLALGESINEIGLSLWESLLSLNELFSRRKENFFKFRGDLAEAIFLFFFKNGEKIFHKSTADILLEQKMIEIKSVSPQKETIVISKQQLYDNTEKYAVYLILSNHGLTITEIAKKIYKNEKFVNYLIEKYQNTHFDKIKYELKKPIDITSKLPLLKFPTSVISANLTIKI